MNNGPGPPPAAAHLPRSEMKGFKWKLRRMVDNIADFFQKGTNVQYSETSDALSRLLQAVGKELMTARSRATPTVKRSAEGKIPKDPSRKHYQRWLRIKDENEKLRAKLASHTAAKAGGTSSPRTGSCEFSSRCRVRTPAA